MSIVCWIVFSKRCQGGENRGLCPGQRVITADINRPPMSMATWTVKRVDWDNGLTAMSETWTGELLEQVKVVRKRRGWTD